MLNIKETINNDDLYIRLEDDFMKTYIFHYNVSEGVKPENIFVDVGFKGKTEFKPVFTLEAKSRKQFVGVSCGDIFMFDMNEMLDTANDLKKIYDELKCVVDFMDKRFPGIIKKET